MIYIAVLNNLIVNGSARFLNKLYANDVDIGGTATFAQLATTGNATIGGTLGITGATTQTGKLTVNNIIEQHGNGIELYYSTPHIDFYYENSTNDFTSRIIENASGVLTITPKFSTPNATITTGNITTLNTNAISNAGAIVTRDMEVVDTLKSYKWDISHVANLANDFTVSPTLQLASGATIQFSAINTSTKVCTFTVTDSSSISSDSLGGVTWTQYSKVKFTMNLNDVVNSNCDGYLTVKMNSTAGTLIISGTLDDVTGLVTGTNYNAEGATIMLYEVGAGSQSTTYPVGIRMTAYGSNKRSYIDIYGGTATSSWTTPHVRIGNVGGLTFNGSTLENQWGIYTDRGYFSGAIVSKEGNIGGFFIDQTNIHNNVTSLTDTSHTGIYLGTDGIRNYNTTGSKHVTIKGGTITANSVDLTGAIKATSGFIGQNATNGFTISNTAIYNPSTKSSLSSDTVDGVYVGKDGIALGKGVFKVTDVGAVTASNINVTGGTIGGWSINNSYGIYTNNKTSATSTNTGILIQKDGAIYAGAYDSTKGSCPFQVTSSGALIATSAEITGDIAADTLHVGTSSSTNHLIYENNTIDLSTNWLKFDSDTETVVIGKSDNATSANISNSDFILKDKDLNPYFYVGDLRKGGENVQVIEAVTPTVYEDYQTLTVSYRIDRSGEIIVTDSDGNTIQCERLTNHRVSSNDLVGDNIYTITYYTTDPLYAITFTQRGSSNNLLYDAIGAYSVSFAYNGRCSGVGAFCEGSSTIANGKFSHAEGGGSRASGSYSHAENEAVAEGRSDHAEGSSYARGNWSHAEGYRCESNATYSHAGGFYSKAEGYRSYARGDNVIAQGCNQFVIGKHNSPQGSELTSENSDYAFIIGNGTVNVPSNALTVDWNGVTSYYGDVTNQSLTVSSALPSIIYATNSNASITGLHFTKKGNLGMLHFTIKSTGAIGGGSNIFQATLAAKYRPAQYTTGVGYYGNHPIIGRITDDGAVLVRNVSTSNVTLTDSVEIAFTYILKDYFI